LGEGPVLLVRDGQVLTATLRRTRLSEDDLRVALRRAAVGSWSDVGAMVLERSGTISVLRRGQMDDALADVDVRRPTTAVVSRSRSPRRDSSR
ncbi:MAG TPA: YetF domain-containing protein, partial [Sporichthyaceae bacterium]